eukprot:jgi/Chlat1/4103/Chrsp26S04147
MTGGCTIKRIRVTYSLDTVSKKPQEKKDNALKEGMGSVLVGGGVAGAATALRVRLRTASGSGVGVAGGVTAVRPVARREAGKQRVEIKNDPKAKKPDPALLAEDVPVQQQQPRVQASKKGRAGKTVTVVTGLKHKPDTLETLLKQLKANCGSGGTLREQELELQGDHTDKVVQLLSKMGYKAKKSGG